MKKIIYFIFITLSLTSNIYANSLIDSIVDQLMKQAGVEEVESLNDEMQKQADEMGKDAERLEKFDIEGISLNIAKKAFEIYERENAPFVPKNWRQMTWAEFNEWNDKHQSEVEDWYNSLPEDKRKELDNEALNMAKLETSEVMAVVDELGGKIFKFKDTTDKMGVALDNFINNYKSIDKKLRNKEIDLTQFPEYKQALEMVPEMINEYINGDRLKAFKKFDEITGLFSNSDAGKGLAMILEASDSVNIGKYVGHIVKVLSVFSGDDTLKNIEDSKIEQAINSIIKDYKTRLGIGSKSDNADIIKEQLESYSTNVDSFIKLPGALDKLEKSPIGGFIKDQLEGKGKKALTDIFSKYSGVDKKDIEATGLVDKIFDFANNLFNQSE